MHEIGGDTLKRIVDILLFTLLSVSTLAQRMPVSVTTILTPPYTSSLSSMSESGGTRLMVNLLVNDITVSELPVKLHIKMESAGVTIESLPTQAVAPMFLGGGEARVLTGDDLAQYLKIDNLGFKGYSKSAYRKVGRLPSGLWKISVSVRHFYTGKTISNTGVATAWITTYKPPVLTAPEEGETAPSNAALPLTFSWQPSKYTGGTATVMYRLEMWERRVDGVPAQTVAASVPAIYETETAGLTATVTPASLALEPGMRYCWRVTAFDPAGQVTFEDGGRSETRTFQYLEKCPEVCGLTIDLRDVTGYATWDADKRHTGGYNIEYYDDEGTCHETRWGYDNKTCGIGGDYGKTWHVRVQGVCDSQVASGWSEWAGFTTPEEFKTPTDAGGKAYECGELPPPREITNHTLAESLRKGDTVEDERGTTKFIIHSATRNDDGTFRGLSYMKLSIWGVKVLGEYDKMTVNTDGVIIGEYTWKSVKSDYLLANPEAIGRWADETALNIAGATYNNTIKDTIRLDGVRFETISREGDRYYALTSEGEKKEITSAINGSSRALVQDTEGHELVIDKDGEPMGVPEYRACGGSKILLRENMREKDSLVTGEGNVKFMSAGGYLFDTYDTYANAAGGYAERFPTTGQGDYRPAYICAESGSGIQVKAEPYKGVTFRTGRGVPVLCRDGLLSVTARGDRDTTSVYAFDSDNNILGKVNVLSYDKETRKVCLVPIGDVRVPDAAEVKAGLDGIFAGLMVDFEVTIADKIEIGYNDESRGFVHGGSGVVGVYNTDQKSAIDKLKAAQPIDNETCYLFLVECGTVNQLDSNDNKQAVGGYMPRGYQYGFIYNQYDNARTIAHELCHGAFHLAHTFDESDFVAPEGATDNLMDYAVSQPTRLNHWQWKDVHQPKSVRFKWLQDEEGAESNAFAFIYWLGHADWGGKYISDDLEDKIDDCLDVLKFGSSKHYKWSDIKIRYSDNTIDTYAEWSVEKSAEVPQIWQSIRDKEATNFKLKANRIYSWSGNVVMSTKALFKDGSEEAARFMYVNIYSFVDDVSLSDYKIKSLSDLGNNTRVKAGFYDYWDGEFFVIAFFSQDGSLDMIIQVPTIGGEAASVAEDWVKVLLMSPAKTKAGEKSLEELKKIDELTPAQIRKYRDYIKTLPEDERAEWYLELQKKVPYHNQRDNESLATDADVENNKTWLKKGDNAGDIMCNLTAEAMCLEMLGIEFPCENCDSVCGIYSQFEDYLECLRRSNQYGARTVTSTRRSLAELFNVRQVYQSFTGKFSENKSQLITYINGKLEKGYSVLMSVWPNCKGHIVRVQSIDEEKIIVDDPNGKVKGKKDGFDHRESCKSGGYEKNDKTSASVVGEDNEWYWSDIENVTIKYVESYEND